MRTILLSVLTIGIVAAMMGAGTFAYFNDTEVAAGNTFTAGEINLKIDIDDYVEDPWTLPFFNLCDVKPGDDGEVTFSIHVYDNDAWVWWRLTNFHDYENGRNEPERLVDPTGGNPGDGNGELSANLYFFMWKDWGLDRIPGTGDFGEGDNIYNECEWAILYDGPASGLTTAWYGPVDVTACITYYYGWQWYIPTTVGNIIQSDSFTFDITFYAVQQKNNPSPTPPR